MPLSLLQVELLDLDAATLQAVKAVHAFLKARPDLAFTPEEIAPALGLDLADVAQILEKFDDLYLVDSGSDDTFRYFRYRADLPEID
jgi:hypothetical protein